MNICQSCSMPMESDDQMGTEKDGSLNNEYCVYCYKDGSFGNPDETLDQMIDSCVPFMVKEGFEEDKAREYLQDKLKDLKRWQK